MADYVKIPDLYDYDTPRNESYHSSTLEKKDLGLNILYALLNAVDWAQTRQISRNTNYYEKPFPAGSSQLIGNHPSQMNVDLLHLAKAIGQPLMATSLPEPYRSLFQSATVGMAANTVHNNKDIGLKPFYRK